MSDTLAQARTLRFHTEEAHEHVRRNGQKADVQFARDVTVRRPDRLKFHEVATDHDFTGWYDGQTLTIVGDRQRIFVRAKVPATLDEMFDYVTTRYEIPMPMADLLYSSAKDSLVAPTTKGGWVKTTQVDGHSCEELTYHEDAVDFTVWIASSAPVLPCRLSITYLKKPGQPTSRLTFSNWNLTPDAAPDTEFHAVVPTGYEEIPIVEHIPKSELTKSTTTGAAPATAPAPKP
jgi:hypothetical protein